MSTLKEMIRKLIRRAAVSKGADPSAGQVAFYVDGINLSGDNNLFWDNANKRLGIRTPSPSFPLDISDSPSSDVALRIRNTNISGGALTKLDSGNGYSEYQAYVGGYPYWSIGTRVDVPPPSSGYNLHLYREGGTGNIVMGADLLPDQDNARNCGNPSHRWALVQSVNIICGDLGFEERTCAVDGERFKPGDKVALAVKSVAQDGIRCVPIHWDDQISSEFGMKFAQQLPRVKSKN